MLLKNGLKINAKSLDTEELRRRAWELFEPSYLQSLDKLAEEYNISTSQGLSTDNLKEAGKAAAGSRIAKILVEQDRIIPGKVNETGLITTDNIENPEVDDLLDDLSELVLKTGGQVMVVPSDKMPTKTGLAAIYRY